MDDSIRSALLARRKSLKLTQTAAGNMASPAIAQKTVSLLEAGLIDPHAATLEAYCRALGLRLKVVRA